MKKACCADKCWKAFTGRAPSVSRLKYDRQRDVPMVCSVVKPTCDVELELRAEHDRATQKKHILLHMTALLSHIITYITTYYHITDAT